MRSAAAWLLLAVALPAGALAADPLGRFPIDPGQVSVAGITLVSGNVWTLQGAEYTFHILDLLRRPLLPVYGGVGLPLLHTPEMAQEAEKRWGTLNYAGAFAMNPEQITPASGTRISLRKASCSGAAPVARSTVADPDSPVTTPITSPLAEPAMAPLHNRTIARGVATRRTAVISPRRCRASR